MSNSNVGIYSTFPKSCWMQQMLFEIGHKKLSEIFIPGSHDSGTYKVFNKIASPWTKTQNKTFYEQLNGGIRYFDCRLMYVTDKNSEHF